MKQQEFALIPWYLATIILAGLWTNSLAQPSVNQEQYLLNPVVLSPSLFNRIASVGGFYSFRSDRSGFTGRPSLHLFDLSGIPNKNMLLDAQIRYIHANLFRSLYFTLGYAYQIRLSENKYLTLSISGALTHEVLDLTDAVVDDPNDPLFRTSNGFPKPI